MIERNPFCCEPMCTRYAQKIIGGKGYCPFHAREIRNKAIAAMHLDNDATVPDESLAAVAEECGVELADSLAD